MPSLVPSPPYQGHYPPIGLDEFLAYRKSYPANLYIYLRFDFDVHFRCRFCRTMVSWKIELLSFKSCPVCGAPYALQRGPV